MPHSMKGSDSRFSLLDLDFDVGTMAGSGFHTGPVGTAVSPTPGDKDDRKQLPSSLTMEERRRSSIADAYNDLMGGNPNHVDSLGGGTAAAGDKASRRTSRNSMNGRYRSGYYEEQFKDIAASGARERMQKEAPVIADLRTNVIIKDEFTLVTDLSYHLAQRYSRPDSSIMINVDHSACLALAGTFEPCYILNISTVPSQLHATTNRRNAALVQSFMADILSVPPERGIVRFIPVPEENLAMNGNTMFGEIERMEKQTTDDINGVKRAYTAPNVNRRSQNFNKRNSLQVTSDNARPNGMSLAEKRRSIPSGVFELATEERPSTSHGPSYAAENGLRLNGISKEDLLGKDTRTANGRPKTFGGQSAKRESSSTSVPTLPNPIQSRPGNIPISPKPTTSVKSIQIKPANGPSAGVPKGISRPVSAATPIKTASSAAADAAAKKAAESKAYDRKSAAKEPTANTAKRRSTITATPKMPAPPPEPADRSDTKSQKVSKRKSFLSAFRR